MLLQIQHLWLAIFKRFLVSSPADFICQFEQVVLSKSFLKSFALPTLLLSSTSFRSAENTRAVKLACTLAHQHAPSGTQGGRSTRAEPPLPIRPAPPFPKHMLEVEIFHNCLSTKVCLFGKFQQNLFICVVVQDCGRTSPGK